MGKASSISPCRASRLDAAHLLKRQSLGREQFMSIVSGIAGIGRVNDDECAMAVAGHGGGSGCSAAQMSAFMA